MLNVFLCPANQDPPPAPVVVVDPMLYAAALDCRSEIDRMDDVILQALDMRARAVQRLAVIKRHQHVPVYDPDREYRVLERVTRQPNLFPPERRRNIFSAIITQMREWQGTLD